MHLITGTQYKRRPVPPAPPAALGGTLIGKWALKLVAFLGDEFAGVQQGTAHALSRVVTADYTAVLQDGLVLADATAAPLTVTLPDPAEVPDMCVTIKRRNGGGNAVTIGATVDGVASPTLASQYAAMTVLALDGAWWKVAAV